MPSAHPIPRCPTCGYHIAASQPVCPECGNPPKDEEDASLLALQASLFLVYGAWALAAVECAGALAGFPQWYFAYDDRFSLYVVLWIAATAAAILLKWWAGHNLLRPRPAVHRLLAASTLFAATIVAIYAFL